MNILKTLIIGALVACASHATLAQEPVLTNRATELRAAPDDTAAVIQKLTEKTSVQVMKRQGPWSQVKAGSQTGWVRMMHLRGGSSVVVESQSPSSSGGFLSSFNKLLLGDRERSGQTRQSATVGVRGFSKEDVAKAEFNLVDFEKLKRFQTSDADAQRFAGQGRLVFRSVAYLSQDAIDGATVKGAKK